MWLKRNEIDKDSHWQTGRGFYRGIQVAVVLVVNAAILFPCSAICLWWAYSMGMSVAGGARSFSQATILTIEMSLLTTVLASIVWLLSPRLHKEQTWLGLAVRTAIETAAILILYTALVLVWRQQWKPADGLSASAAFLPFIGNVNAAFFSEFLWLEYLICVIPLTAILSGVLTSSFDFLQDRRQLKGRRSAFDPDNSEVC
jgi:hypothetical protein